MDTLTFWKQMDVYGRKIADLSPWQGDVTGVCEICGDVCALLRSEDALKAMADPLSAPQVEVYRHALADHWSVLNGHLEEQLARQVWAEALDQAAFLRVVNSHPLFHNGDQVVAEEIKLLERQGLDIKGLRVAVIGPGAIPYTALQFAAQGAAVLGVDYSAEVCLWLRHWVERYFPACELTTFEGYAHTADYSDCDVVVVAAMLLEKPAILAKLAQDKPRYVVLRNTSSRRPLGVLQPDLAPETLELLKGYGYVAETCPPLNIGNFSLLYRC